MSQDTTIAKTRRGAAADRRPRRLARSARSARCAAWAAALAAAATLTAPPAWTSQVRIFQTQGAAGFLGGKLTGVSVDALGRVRLAPQLQRVAAIGEPFLFAAAAVHGPSGDFWAVGTGNSGKVLAIERDGKVRELFTAPEPEVFALWADPDGTIYAGTSPHGKVYRIAGGKGTVFFDPGETYIWALARDAAGRLLVATGTQGKLFRVDAGGRGEIAMTAEDTHIRSLAPQPNGDVLVGTAGKGLILRLGRDGRQHTVFQAEEPEVVALVNASDGSSYAAAIASEASLVDLGRATEGSGAAGPGGGGAPPPNAGAPPAGAGGGKPAAKPARSQPSQASAADEGGDGSPVGSRRAGAAGPRSEILHLAADGRVETVWSFAADTIFSLLWQDGKLWVGTGVEGKLFTYAAGQIAIEGDLEDHQIVALLPGDGAPAFATTNAAAVYRIAAGTERRGTYLSAALDAGQLARFGSFRWRGELPEGAAVHFSFRSGMSSVPDAGWSSWVAPAAGAEEASPPSPASPLGGELSLRDLPRGRFVQWRAELEAAGARGQSAVLYAAELSYRQENLRPRIASFAALDPGQILVPLSFNPTNQVYEPAHPNHDGIFVPIGAPAGDETGGGRTKVLWKMGFQTLRWSAADPNEDPLVFDLYVRPAGADAAPWLKMATDVDDDHYSFDATALPDGVYRFRLVASDRLANDADAALSAERIGEPVVIDHTPPALVAVRREGKELRATVHDALSPVREAVYSIDAGPWKPARAADGLLDGLTETLIIDDPEPRSGQLLLLRVTDAAYNVVTFDLSRSR
jgi:hypothetical protein